MISFEYAITHYGRGNSQIYVEGIPRGPVFVHETVPNRDADKKSYVKVTLRDPIMTGIGFVFAALKCMEEVWAVNSNTIHFRCQRGVYTLLHNELQTKYIVKATGQHCELYRWTILNSFRQDGANWVTLSPKLFIEGIASTIVEDGKLVQV